MDKERIKDLEHLPRIVADYTGEIIKILETMGYEVSKKKNDDLVLVNTREDKESNQSNSYPPHHHLIDTKRKDNLYGSEK